jgi:hypothetical protein
VSDFGHVKPAAGALVGDDRRICLSNAMQRIGKVEVKEPGTDITHGTTFYTPIVTLLARTIPTKRQDVVYSVWPILCCPYIYFESNLPPRYAIRLKQHEVKLGHKPRLWEILDLLIAVGGWSMRQLVEWVRQVESTVSQVTGLTETMQAAADMVLKEHDKTGFTHAPGLTEGIVIPVDGLGRVN